ncbi:MAG: hypothetical protein ACYS8Z_20065 [Planctomycetota bacterium]|jgi:hypothetical protein
MFKSIIRKIFGESPFRKAMQEKPRYHHYVFAHRALCSLALSQPEKLIQTLKSAQANKFLSELLANIDSKAPEDTARRDFTVEDIAVHPFDFEGSQAVIVEMPEPKNCPEVFFASVVYPSTCYFTLEKLADAFSGPDARAVFCSWSRNIHRFGTTVANPTLDEFKGLIIDALNQSSTGTTPPRNT